MYFNEPTSIPTNRQIILMRMSRAGRRDLRSSECDVQRPNITLIKEPTPGLIYSLVPILAVIQV